MIASGFNRSIVFEKEDTTTNSVGTPIEGYQFLKESWANVRLLTGATQYTEDAGLPFSDIEFIVRYDEEIDYSCRIYYDNQYYKIKHIHTQGRKDYTQIRATVWENEDQV